MLAANQRAVALKFEVVATVANAEWPTADRVVQLPPGPLDDAFASPITTPVQPIRHAWGSGMERIALALFAAHGTDTSRWPEAVRRQLWP